MGWNFLIWGGLQEIDRCRFTLGIIDDLIIRISALHLNKQATRIYIFSTGRCTEVHATWKNFQSCLTDLKYHFICPHHVMIPVSKIKLEGSCFYKLNNQFNSSNGTPKKQSQPIESTWLYKNKKMYVVTYIYIIDISYRLTFILLEYQ